MDGVTIPTTEDGRTRNKRATRHGLRRAVLELSAERGLASVTVDEIARRAGVSPRTFFNYFDTKEDAAVVELFVSTDDALTDFATGAGDQPWNELSALMSDAVARAFEADPDLLQLLQLQAGDPAIQAQQLRYFGRFVHRLSDAVAQRLGTGRHPMTADLMAGSCITAVRVGMDHWAGGDGRGRPDTPIAAAFAVLAPAFGETP